MLHYYVDAAYRVYDLARCVLLVQEDRGHVAEVQHFFLLWCPDYGGGLFLLELADELLPHWTPLSYYYRGFIIIRSMVKYLYELWPGNNRFCCRKYITGPLSDWAANAYYYCCLLVVMIPYYIFVAPKLWT